MIRAVVLDVGGVLVSESDWSEFDERWSARLGLDLEEFERLASVDPDGEHLIGAISEQQLHARWTEVSGFDAQTAAEWRRESWDLYCGVPDPVMIDFTRSLRPAYLTGLCSNSADGARREESRRYGFDTLTDDLVYSHEVGVAKPDPRMYDLVCARLGVIADEVVFVDDREVNVAGAAEVAMHGVLHRSARETVAAVRRLLA